jgi:hypothetical protein
LAAKRSSATPANTVAKRELLRSIKAEEITGMSLVRISSQSWTIAVNGSPQHGSFAAGSWAKL